MQILVLKKADIPKHSFIIILLFFCVSCVDKQCFFPIDPKLYIDAKYADTSKTFLDTLSKVKAIGRTDTIANVKSGKRLAIPLNQNSDTTSLALFYKNSTRIDTLVVTYNRDVKLGSAECGYVTFFQNLSIVKSTAPSILKLKQNVDTSKSTTLRIIIR